MTIEVETGPMFSGKSTELKRYVNRLEIAGRIQGEDFLVYNYINDIRYGENVLSTHTGEKASATLISSSQDILLDLFTADTGGNISLKDNRQRLQAIFIDEAQFFDKDLGYVLSFIDSFYLTSRGQGLRIYCAGLDMDFRGEPFPTMADLFSRAERVNKFTAVCETCGEDAPFSQRLVNGQPVSFNDPTVLIGTKDHYTARCPKHHKIPGKPIPTIK